MVKFMVIKICKLFKKITVYSIVELKYLYK